MPQLLRLHFVLLSVFLTGCVSLYNRPRHDLAVAAQKSVQDAKLEQVLDDERKQNAGIAQAELGAVTREAHAMRDQNLISVIGQKNAKLAEAELRSRVLERRKALDGDNDDLLLALVDIDELERAVDRRATRYRTVVRKGDPSLTCGAMREAKEFSSPELFAIWSDFQKRCEQLRGAREQLKSIADPSASAIAAVETRIAANVKAIHEAEARVTSLTTSYRQQAKELAARRAKGERDLGKTAKDLQEDLAKIGLPAADSLDFLGASGARARLALDWLNTQHGALTTLVDAAAESPATVPAGVDDSIQIAAMLPSIHNELVAGSTYPRVTSLVHELQRVGIERDGWQRQVLRHEQQVATLKRQRWALLEERDRLSDATVALKDSSTVCAEIRDGAKTRKLEDYETFADVPDTCGERLRFALNAYADAWTLGRAPAALAEWELVHLDHERALDASESALRSWNSLLSVQLDALVASYATGATPEDIGRVVQAIELGAIAVAVP